MLVGREHELMNAMKRAEISALGHERSGGMLEGGAPGPRRDGCECNGASSRKTLEAYFFAR